MEDSTSLFKTITMIHVIDHSVTTLQKGTLDSARENCVFLQTKLPVHIAAQSITALQMFI